MVVVYQGLEAQYGLPQVCLVDEERKGVLSTFLWCKLQAVGVTNMKLISSFPRTGCGLTYDDSDSNENHGCTSTFPKGIVQRRGTGGVAGILKH